MNRIFAKSTLREFWENHPDTEQYLKTWYDTAINANWQTPADVKQAYSTASILKNGRIVFNIKALHNQAARDDYIFPIAAFKHGRVKALVRRCRNRNADDAGCCHTVE